MATILCIEDERDLRADIAEELSDAGFAVLQAENGKEGLRQILTHHPDLVTCDINMPVMNGKELLSELRDKHPEFAEMPFIFLTAYASREHVLEGLRLGVDDYITKPVDFDILIAKVNQRLRQVRAIVDRKNQELVALYNKFKAAVQPKKEEESDHEPFPIALNSIPIVILGKLDNDLRQLIDTLRQSFINVAVFTEDFTYLANKRSYSVHFIFVYKYEEGHFQELTKALARESRKSIVIYVTTKDASPASKGQGAPANGNFLVLPASEEVIKQNMVGWIKSKLASEFHHKKA